MHDSSFHRATYMEVADLTNATDTASKPEFGSERGQPWGRGRSSVHELKRPGRIPWLKYLKVGGVLYTVLWSILLYFGWKGSPEFITWLDLITGISLVHLSYQLCLDLDVSNNGKFLQLLQLGSLLYATAWTLIVMFVFGVEVLLPLDFVSLYVTITLMRQLWRSLRHIR